MAARRPTAIGRQNRRIELGRAGGGEKEDQQCARPQLKEQPVERVAELPDEIGRRDEIDAGMAERDQTQHERGRPSGAGGSQVTRASEQDRIGDQGDQQ